MAAADGLCRRVRATRLRAAAGELPGAITSLTHIVRTRPGTESRQALASTYRTAHDIALKFGYPDLAAVAEVARDLARQIGGEAGEVHRLSFGQTDIDLHALGARVRMKQWDEGLEQARAIHLPLTTLMSRRARYLVDRAVVEMETGHAAASLRHLVSARSLAPEQTRNLPGARDAVNGLIPAGDCAGNRTHVSMAVCGSRTP
ncbi:hypothetical protein OG909_12500 [Streptomyces sp. NBC_01754]|uniref:hypothetical protein n=1 Tax=Streptomyces sp. NBC_01754 TaxID=2975930 RepID=UPI002DD9E659|nr:hypothetical protein [Streptomyces sp. NBC_01754]WSC93046.1 hypothetical protein OG909_12500 [Streptomyces sp. NBC_01754]